MWNMTKLRAKPWSTFIITSFLDLIFPTPLTALFMWFLAGSTLTSTFRLRMPTGSTETWTTRNFPWGAANPPQQAHTDCPAACLGLQTNSPWALVLFSAEASLVPCPVALRPGPAAAQAQSSPGPWGTEPEWGRAKPPAAKLWWRPCLHTGYGETALLHHRAEAPSASPSRRAPISHREDMGHQAAGWCPPPSPSVAEA